MDLALLEQPNSACTTKNTGFDATGLHWCYKRDSQVTYSISPLNYIVIIRAVQ